MIDDYLARLRSELRVTGKRRDRIVDDVRDHLEDAIAALRRDGTEAGDAERMALAAFGPASQFAAQINSDAATLLLRRTPAAMVLAGLAVVGGLLFAAVPQPAPGLPKPAGLGGEISFFAGTVGLQVAFIAGVRAAARTLARWRRTPSAADLHLLRRTALVFVGGLIASAVGWTVALLDAVSGRPHGRVVPLVVGLAMIIGGSTLAAATTARWRRTMIVVPPDGDGDELPASVFALPERFIQWMAAKPALACTSAALVAALAAMSRAETTAAGALPWGLAEAAFVVAGYVMLGPALELRT